jgi:hypothetical protein
VEPDSLRYLIGKEGDMATIAEMVDIGLRVLGTGGLLYTSTVGLTAAVSIFAKSTDRRRDARATLSLLLRSRRRGP